MDWSIKNGLDIDKIMDAYNNDPEKLQVEYKNARKQERDRKNGKMPWDDTIIRKKEEAAISKKNNNDDLVTALKALVKCIESKVSYKEDKDKLWVNIQISSPLSEYIEETTMVFEGGSKDDKGTYNAVHATVGELSFAYLLNF